MSNNSNNNNNHSPKHPLEVPVFSPTSAALALAAGAQRLELNRAGSYPNGGLTPSIADLEVVACGCGGADVPVRVMIRPRGAGPGGGDEDGKEDLDFVYTDAEFEEMKQCMEVMIATPGLLRPERGDGFVFGVLKKQDDEDREKEQDGEGKAKGKAKVVVDVERNSELVRLAGGLPCVFHRAFDDILGSQGATPEVALADLATCNFHGLLTSGGPGSAADHPETLSRIIRAAGGGGGGSGSGGGGRLREIIVGGGVRSSSVAQLSDVLALDDLGASGSSSGDAVRVWFHSSCLTGNRGMPNSDDLVGVDAEELEKEKEDADVVDGEELRAIVRALAC